MKKYAKFCEGEGLGAVVGCDAKGARYRALADLYLCSACYREWLGVRHVDQAEPAASSSAAVVGAHRTEEDW